MNYFEKRAKMSAEEIEKKEKIYFYVVKEFMKAIFVEILFTLVSSFVGKLFISCYGLEEYLKKDILRLFVDDFFIRIAPIYVNKIDEYFVYVAHNSLYDNYLWIIPYFMSMIYLYLSYWIAHKIVDRSGVGATKRLDFLHFFFIFSVSNIFARIDIFSYFTIFWWYIFYKVIKIGVLKIEEKFKK